MSNWGRVGETLSVTRVQSWPWIISAGRTLLHPVYSNVLTFNFDVKCLTRVLGHNIEYRRSMGGGPPILMMLKRQQGERHAEEAVI